MALELVPSPRPSSPEVFVPQTQSDPSDFSASVCHRPVATFVNPEPMRTGVGRDVVVPSPSSPDEFLPQAQRLPSTFVAKLKPSPPRNTLDQIVPGMVADVVPDSATSSPYVATVETVNRVIDTANGTFGVRLHLPNHDHHIPAGLPCTVHFHTP